MADLDYFVIAFQLSTKMRDMKSHSFGNRFMHFLCMSVSHAGCAASLLLITLSLGSPPASVAADAALPKSSDVLASMRKTADWQLANPGKDSPLHWTQAALYTGMMALGDIAADVKYRAAMAAVGRGNSWKPGERPYHADDHCVGQMYCEMYALERDPDMIAPLRERFDFILTHPSTAGVELITKTEGIPAGAMRWWWCDALFMGPPAWTKLYAITGETKYLDFMIREWRATSGFLYDRDEHLYFRDQTYFQKKEANGTKVFWSRGNGWVLAGLVRVLQVLPSDHPSRLFFEGQLREMAEAALKSQQPDGLWRPSLLDPVSYPIPESSGSGFFCYAFAWGVNEGLLPRDRFQPAALKAWSALLDLVEPDGRLTHVQPVGSDPRKFDPSLSHTYGVGSFLLAGSEVYRMALLAELPHVRLRIRNTSDSFRPQEGIEIDWATLRKKLPGATEETVAVMDGLAARWLPTQTSGTKSRLLLQADFLPRQSRIFAVFVGVPRASLPSPGKAPAPTRREPRLKAEWMKK